MSKCGKIISDTFGYASCATFLFLPDFDVICDLLLNRRTATWNLFVKYERLEDNGALANGACISRNDFFYMVPLRFANGGISLVLTYTLLFNVVDFT